MKQIKLLLLILAMLMPMMVNADPVEINGIYYNLTSPNIAEVTSNPNKYSGSVTIPETVTYGEVEYSVTSIGDYAFDDCFGLASITIPNSVTSIGFGAFINCSGLTSITIPNSVLVIADRAFYYCTSLTSVTIPNSVTSIGNSVFSACTALSSMVVESGNSSYDSRNNCNAFIKTSSNTLIAGCMNTTIPNSVTSIGGDALYKCSGLTHITIPNSVTSIGDYAFYGCSGLTSITIPNSVTRIGFDAFSDCSGLISVAVESGNTVYDSRNDCDAIIETASNTLIKGCKNTIIPNNVTNIGNNAFASCSDLTSIVIPNSVTTIGGDAFASCSSLASIIIPNSVTNIGEQAFRKCHGLTSITVESGNTIYDSRDDCNAIVETASNTLKAGCMNTTIPNSVTNIGNCAFWGCSNLTSISIPNSVTSIGSEAFEDCLNLTDVYCYADNVPNTSSDAFYNSNIYNATLHVPNGSIDTYKAIEPWKNFKNIVEMAPDPTITITAKSYSRAYGEDNPKFEYDVTGGTVTGTPSITCTATTTSNVGTYDIVITAGTISDPSVQYVNGTLTVAKAPLKITAKSYTRKQGEANPEFGVTYEGFKNNETDAVLTTKPTVTCAATKDSPAGTYDITVSGAVAANYEISYVAGTLTIETPPTPMPEPKGTTFDLDTDDSSSKEVKVTFVVKESDSSGTPTVAISDDKDASGSVSIPESVTHNGVEYKVTEISEGAFQNNTSLTEVTIPASITSIGPKAFAGCKNLQAITINIIVPINIAVISARGLTRTDDGDVFEGVDKETCILYVPEGSVDVYKAAPGWKDFKNILAIGTTGIHGVVVSHGESFDVFTLSGLKVKSKATSLDGLPKGIYIINGKKVIKQ